MIKESLELINNNKKNNNPVREEKVELIII